MSVRTDPEGHEIVALLELAELDGAEVLEIGSGDGRLTWRYAERTAHVTGIEPFEDSIARAVEQQRGTQLPVEFQNEGFEEFASASDADVFDVALLSWSLC
jgi:2-polyprenyl-3-methyl-5-hydroxy-6-metoxy-1,4-benzoquinol methylase